MLWILCLSGMTGLFIYGVVKQKKEQGLKHPFLSFGIFLSDGISSLMNTFLYKQEINTERDRKEREPLKGAIRAVLLYFMVFFSVLTALILDMKSAGRAGVTKITMPAFGEDRSVDLRILGLTDEEEVRLNILSREPGGEEWEALFDRVYEEILIEMLGENESYSYISRDLELLNETEEGIGILYLSETPEVLSSRGRILKEEIPEEGAEAVLQVTLEYKDFRKTYHKKMMLYTGDADLSDKERLLKYLNEANEEHREEAEFTLPESFEGHRLTYRIKGMSAGLIPVFALVVCGLFLFLPEEKRKEEKRKREDRLMAEYPGLVSRLSILISANLSIRSAWERILKEKEAEIQENDQEEDDPLYREMLKTRQNLNKGMAEADAYSAFGRSCGLYVYQRLSGMLEQNLRQGISGLEKAMKGELSQALQEKKNRALARGEKAGTRLLLPMMLMLMIILIILMVPAFFSL